MSKIVAHRGQNTTHPENTLDSIKQAVECGAKAVEFDVQMSADHIPLVCHDINLQRTANVEMDISQHNFDELRDFNVGEPARFADQYASSKLPSLKEMVNLLAGSSEVIAFVELKDESIDVYGIETFVLPIIELLQPIQEQCVIIADNLDALTFVQQRTAIPIGWIIHAWDERDFILARDNSLDYLVINHKYFPEHPHDFSLDPWQWVVYETQSPDMVVQLFKKGVAFVETDDVCQMLSSVPDFI